MILISMIVTAVVFFVAGMHYATWDQNRNDPEAEKSIWWAVVLVLIGFYNMTTLVGLASRA